MKRTIVMLSLTLAVGIALGLLGSQVLTAQQMPMKRTTLLKTDLPRSKGKNSVLIRWNWPQGWLWEALSPRKCVRLCPGRLWGLGNRGAARRHSKSRECVP